MINKNERVICAAIWFNDGEYHFHQPDNIETGFVICGWRHGSILSSVNALGNKIGMSKQIQGFLTNNNRFLNRSEARAVVLYTGQLKMTMFDDELYSEDLY